MLIPRKIILESKNKLGDEAALIIAKDLQLEKWDEKNLKGLCAFHQEETASFVWDGKPNDQYFYCFGCGKIYDIITHYMSFNKLTYIGAIEKLFEQTNTPYRFGEKGIKTDRDFIYPKYDCIDDRTQVEEYLALRGLSKETLDYCDVQQDSNNNIVFNFYDTNDVLTLVKYRPARKLKKSDVKGWYQADCDKKFILFNMNRVDPSKPLVITEGEIDCLSVIESGYTNCVSIPGGTQNTKWVEECFEWLEQFEKIIIWADNDGPGIIMRKDICARRGVWRSLFVDLPTSLTNLKGEKIPLKDANEVLYHFGKEKVINLIENAQEIPVMGVSDLASVADFDIENEPGLYLNLKAINEIVYKFLFRSVILVTGIRGAGKSTFLNQSFVCDPLQQGHDVFLFSGELGAPVLKSWVELTMAGPEKTKMKDKFIHVIAPETRKLMREWYKERIWIYNDNSNKSEDILNKAISVTRKYGAKVWVLDNLMTIDIGASSINQLEKQTDFIVRLNHLAMLYNVLIVLVCHPRKLITGQELVSDDISGSGNLGNLAQYLLSVKRFSKKEKLGEKDNKGNYKKGHEPIEEDVEVEVMKNRYTGKIDKARAYFDYTSYRFYNTPDELYKRYNWWPESDKTPIPTRDHNDHNPSPFN